MQTKHFHSPQHQSMSSHTMYNNINPPSTTLHPSQGSTIHVYGSLLDDMLFTSSAPATANSTNIGHYDSLFYNLSLLRDKVEQVESMVGIIVSADHVQRGNFFDAVAGATAIAQDIVVVASSMIFAFQKMASGESNINDLMENFVQASSGSRGGGSGDRGSYDGQALSYNVQRYEPCKPSKIPLPPDSNKIKHHTDTITITTTNTNTNDVIELDAADLLAKYTHYCHICGKGFKRDANLRMHMRAHGDQYKTNAALANPSKQTTNTTSSNSQNSKYSCPQEGCRWNKNHAKFQPLKSMVCVKNHYKRSHCPKMYICNRCNRKQFSVLSDLRTHEKHCGDLRWRCSCGTSFSRKDKLMGHVALFVGHKPFSLSLKDKL